MDTKDDDRGNDDDEALLAYFLPSMKDGECSRQRPDSRTGETERASPLHAPSPPEPPNLPVAYQEPEQFTFDPFEYPESEVARSKMINDALQQEDEFLEYLMSLPMSHKFSEVVDEKHEHCELRSGHLGAGIGESDDPPPHSMPVSKVGLDHLDNLCKLMEQLGELRDQNSKLQRRVQYLEDLKSLHDMHKQLQESLDSKRRQDRRRRGDIVQLEERFSPLAERKLAKDSVEGGDSRLTVKRHASEESVLQGVSPLSGYTVEFAVSADSKSSSKRKSIPRSRQSFRRQTYRERSRSVGNDDVGEAVREAIKNPRKSAPTQWQRQRRGFVKSKVSKWTKVKEAFRWEKAQLDGCSQRTMINDFTTGLPESKSQDSGIGLGQRQVSEDRPHDDPSQCLLRVKEVEPSASPSDSVLGGSSYHAYSYALSSSSSSSDDLMEIDLNLSSISEAIDIGPQRSASATDSTAEKLVQSEECSDQRGRRSLSQGQDDDAARRSKSLDCEDIQRPYATFVLDDKGGSISKKSHRTPWGKVKDIIQTRRDSVKKRQKDDGRREDGRVDSEHTTILIDQEEEGDRSGCESPEEADGVRWHQKVDGRMEERRKGFRTTSPGSSPRRLTPTLTVTHPSTEELSGSAEWDPGDGQRVRLGDARIRGYSDCEEQDGPHHRKDGQSQLGEGATDTSGTSPPAPRRPSKWTKVKKAFLTAKKEVDGTARGADTVGSSRIPCSECSVRRLSNRSPVSQGLRIYLEGCGPRGVSNEMGRVSCTRGRRENSSEMGSMGTAPPSPAAETSIPKTNIQTTQRDIQKNYDELQQTLSQEFHKKLSEWERMKGGWCTVPESKDDSEDVKKKHSYEWEKSKEKASGRTTAPDESHLPIDFRRRLLEWKRVRASEARPETMTGRGRVAPGGRGSVLADDESLPPQFRKRLVEWQLWRAVTGKSDQNVEELHKILPEEFYRKLQEWERIKAEAVVPVGVSGGRQFGRREPVAGGMVMRKDASAIGRVVRRMRANEAALGEKWSRQRSEVAREVKHRGKEVQWLEKELQKVEREKLRLEREREKYLEREARLERMRKAMGQRPPGEQEVLIQTSTGFFRFQGISEKFTRKLYEWEKQRGIGPEASTFTLLDPTYRPASASAASAEVGGGISLDTLRSSACSPGSPSPALPRSRSEGSLAESGGPVHSRSSSLGQIDGKERSRSLEQEVPSRASSEPRMRSETRAILVSEETDEEDDDEEETAALLVEVEDVEIETAAALEELPTLPSETPIYSYAPEEVTRLIDSSGSESEKECKCYGEATVNRSSSVRTQSSYELIEENMSLINKLKAKENICRELENEIEDLEGKIQDIAKTHQEELERLRMEETGLKEKTHEADDTFGSIHGSCHGDMVAQLKQRVDELERCKEQLKQEEENLQTSFQVHAEQQEALAQNLVGKMKLLQEVSKGVGTLEDESIEEIGDNDDQSCRFKRSESDLNDFQSMAIVQNLSSELLQLAEKLELTLADRNQEIRNLRFELQDRKKSGHNEYQENRSARFRSGQTRNWSSAEGMHLSLEENLVPLSDSKMTKFTKTMIPRQSSEELAELPFLLTSKVLQLKKELSNLCNPQEPKASHRRCQPCRGKLQRIPHFQADEEEADSDWKAEPPEDTYSSWRTKYNVEDRITYRPPPRPTTGVDEGKERAACRPNSGSFSTDFGERGLAPGAISKMAEEGAVRVTVGKLQEPEKDPAIAEETKSVGVAPSFDSVMGETTRWKGEKMLVENTREAQLQGIVKCSGDDRNNEINKEEDKGVRAHTECENASKEREHVLKTRRISDTHVTYDSTRVSKVPRKLSRDFPASPPRATKDSGVPKISREGVVITKPKGELIEIESQVEVSKVASECTAPNVFVQTTRKIFTPVCVNSKGNDSSNVIGYVEEYLEDTVSGSASETVAPPWRRKSGGLPPTERTTSRPHRSPPELPKGGGESLNRVSHHPDTSSNSLCSHPLPPPSPISARREKVKEAAPSIRLMIAKYDLKQQQQQDGGNDGRSPESRSSGGRSPAWLSPTVDRRDIFGLGGVKAQMEKYQEEVRKALMGHSNSETASVQKSASAGIIRSFGLGPCLKPPLNSIAKSSSAGAIKSGIEEASPSQVESNSLAKTPFFKKEDKGRNEEEGSVQLNESIEKTLKMLRERHPSPPPSPSRSQKFAHIRAMRLKKAKEEFMKSSNLGGTSKEEEAQSMFIPNQEAEKQDKKGSSTMDITGESVMSEGSAGISENCSGDMKAAPTKVEVKMRGGGGRGAGEPSKVVPEGSRASSGPEEGVSGGVDARSRHSQISFGSESSYEESVAIPEGLIKSASSGMINLYSQKCKQQAPMAKVSVREGGLETVLSPSSSKCLSTVADGCDGQGTSKLGILSRFRRVKLRTKKMSAISALCRQSLLVSVDKESGESEAGESEGVRKRHEGGKQKSKISQNYTKPLCRSCPSSPVPSSKKPENIGSWIHNPKHVFKAQRDCEENFSKTTSGVSLPNKR